MTSIQIWLASVVTLGIVAITALAIALIIDLLRDGKK